MWGGLRKLLACNGWFFYLSQNALEAMKGFRDFHLEKKKRLDAGWFKEYPVTSGKNYATVLLRFWQWLEQVQFTGFFRQCRSNILLKGFRQSPLEFTEVPMSYGSVDTRENCNISRFDERPSLLLSSWSSWFWFSFPGGHNEVFLTPKHMMFKEVMALISWRTNAGKAISATFGRLDLS